MEQLR